MEANTKKLRIFRASNGSLPFIEWLEGLRDLRAKQKVQARIDRLSLGNFGQAKPIGEGVHELKINYGPGYRIYFGSEGDAVVILLVGGDKGSQNEDIKKAKRFWREYKEKKEHANS